jgi:hydrophobic/amphiphilic exporter-1 (mainly G- bacteria), HAE1 family
MSISELSVRRPVTTTMAALIVTILGAVSFLRIPIDLMPEITFPTVTISTEYENVNPQEIETLLTEPVERAVSSVAGVKEVSSVSVEGRSQVRVSFAWGTDLDAATNDVREKIDRIRDNLPRDANSPVISKYDVNASPIIFVGIAGDLDSISLRTFVENQLRHRLERVPGVSAADIRGGLEREIHVDLSLAKLRALNLSPADVVAALRAENVDLPAGHLDRAHLELTVRTLGQFSSLKQIRDSVVTRRGGTPVYLRDVARVSDSYKEVDHVVRIDGRNAVMVSIVKQPGANTVAVTDLVKQEIERINRDFPRIRAQVVFDHARYIRRSIHSVLGAGIWGAALAVLIILFFLRNLRSTLIVSAAIPISIVATFALMYAQGFTINVMSFGGLALGIGMLLDNSIVVLENIFRHRERGSDRGEAVRSGTREVAGAITASTLTTLAVFLPLLFIPGPAGILFKQLAWVVFFALAVSLLVALTLVPVMTYQLLKAPPRPRESGLLARVFRFGAASLAALDAGYHRLLIWSLGHKAVVLATAIALVALSVNFLPYIGREFMPKADEGEVRILAEMEEGTKIEKMDEAFRAIEATVGERAPEAQNVFTHFGRFGFSARGKNSGHVHLWLTPRNSRERSDEEIAGALRGETNRIPGLTARVRARAGLFIFRRLGLSEDDNLEVQLRGHDPARAEQLAERIKAAMERVSGLVEVRINREGGQPELGVEIDRERAAALGIPVATVAETIKTSLIGTRATLYREGGNEFDVLVRLAEADRRSPSALMDLAVRSATGGLVLLKELIRVQERRGPMEIHRLDQERVVTLSGQVSGRDMGSVIQELEARLGELRLPEDFSIVFGGDYREQQESFRELRWGLLLALVLVYMVMAAQFESLRDPLLIMASVPVAVVGIVLVLLLTGTTLNVNSFIGIILLSGIVVNNAIVLVDYINMKMREDGLSAREAVLTGGRTRLRPILMTTLTTVLAMVPLAVGFGEGGEVQAPLARVVIGGLSVSTLITLVLIPVLYAAVKEWQPVGVRQLARGKPDFANGRLFRK